MTPGQTYLEQGFRLRLEMYGREIDPLTLPVFDAIIEPMPLIEADFPTGKDSREYVMLHALRSDVPAIVLNQTVTDKHSSQKYRIVKREDNPSDFVVKFWAVKMVAGKDT